MRVIVKRMEDVTKTFDDYGDMAKEVTAEVKVDDDEIMIVQGETMLLIPREVFTGIGL